MVLLVLEAHRALHFRSRVDKSAEWIAGEGVVVAAGVDVFKFTGLVKMALCVRAFEEESLNFVGGVERVTFLLVEFARRSS